MYKYTVKKLHSPYSSIILFNIEIYVCFLVFFHSKSRKVVLQLVRINGTFANLHRNKYYTKITNLILLKRLCFLFLTNKMMFNKIWAALKLFWLKKFSPPTKFSHFEET